MKKVKKKMNMKKNDQPEITRQNFFFLLQFPVQILLMDGMIFEILADPAMIVLELFDETITCVALQNAVGWAIYEASGELERSLGLEENIGDIMSKWSDQDLICFFFWLISFSWQYRKMKSTL